MHRPIDRRLQGRNQGPGQAAELRLRLWGDTYISAKTLARNRENFQAMIDGPGEGATKTRGTALLADLNRHGEFMGFAAD